MVFGLASVASAANDNSLAGIALHITTQVTKGPCPEDIPVDNSPDLTAGTIVQEVFPAACDGLTAYTVYVLVCNGSDRDPGFADVGTGVAGLEFGLTYGPQIAIGGSGFNVCADQAFPHVNFPDSGTGNLIAWDSINNCQEVPSEPFVPQTVVALAGWMDVFASSPGVIAVTPRPVSGLAKVADCNSAETVVSDGVFGTEKLGQAGFCEPGHNPCDLATPVEETTWGSIKKQFDN